VKPCQICGAPMIRIDEQSEGDAATRFECGKWRVHPSIFFGVRKVKSMNAPSAGVPR